MDPWPAFHLTPLLSPGIGAKAGMGVCSSWTSERKGHQRALSSPKIQGGWGWELGPLALRKSWEILSA